MIGFSPIEVWIYDLPDIGSIGRIALQTRKIQKETPSAEIFVLSLYQTTAPLSPAPMEASEVLSRYATGERDFRRANLRGQSFKGQNLAGADFSEADLRGTNFTQAQLQGANFTRATAGVQRRWLTVQFLLSLVLSVLLNFTSTVLNAIFIAYLFTSSTIEEITVIPGIALLVFIGSVFFAIARQGFTVNTISTITIAFAVTGAVAVAVAVAVASLLLGIYCSRRALKGDEKFSLLRSFGIAFAALGGTRFYQADLTGANFTSATLKSTNFRAATLTHVCWHTAQKLDRARVGDSIH